MERAVLHLPLLGVIVAGMIVGVVAGIGRLGIEVPGFATDRIAIHGPVLVAAVFGTLISLERAVAMRTLLGSRWTWADAAPVLGAAGTIVLLASGATSPAMALLAASAAVLVAINVAMLRRHPSLDVATMAIGAGFLLLANSAWLADRAVALLVPWWMAFLVLTITGERLELARLRVHGRAAMVTFAVAAALYIGALLLMVIDAAGGARLSGIGMLALAAWLMRYDIAWVTVRRTGLPRFTATCLLSGYVWLAVAGAIALIETRIWAGFSYDAYVHAILLGFVFSMVFGHAPIIFPAILGRPIRYLRAAWLPLVLLHVSVAARIVGDILADQELRQAAGVLTGVAIAIYGAVIVVGSLRGPETGSASAPKVDTGTASA